ncbi:MAG: DUF6249 domain-containing protein [Flavobacteriaceae bacterium]
MIGLNATLGILIPLSAILLPVLIIWIVFVYKSRDNKVKYDALIEVSKNINAREEIKELLDSFKERKSSTDLRRSGVVTIFVGIGLFFLGYFGLEERVIAGVGLLVTFIGIGQIIAGYIYPNQTDEINRAVENFEKR